MDIEICSCCGKPKRPKLAVLSEAEGCVSSPPYTGSTQIQGGGANAYGAKREHDRTGIWPKGSLAYTARGDDGYGTTPGQLGAMPEGDAGAVISSPPYTGDALGHAGSANDIDKAKHLYSRMASNTYGKSDGQLGQMPEGDVSAVVSSPPYAADDKHDHTHDQRDDRRGKRQGRGSFRGQYGKSDGQIAAMPAGDLDAAVSSPPYNDARQGWKTPDGAENIRYGSSIGQMSEMASGDLDATISSPPFRQTTGGTNVTSESGPLSDARLIERHAAGNGATQAYGADPSNLANMAEGEAVVSSPPFENQVQAQDPKYQPAGNGHGPRHSDYGDTSGNIGNDQGDTFWGAARTIVEQTYLALRPGAHACFVLKGFIRNGQLVDFPHQWQALCESVGFVTLHEHHALLVEKRGTQLAHDGNHRNHDVARKSFFRRLAERKGSPAIDFETCLCMVRP